MTDEQLLQVFRCMVIFAGLKAPGDSTRIVGPNGYIKAESEKLHVFAYRWGRGTISFFHGDVHEQRGMEQIEKVQEFLYTDQRAGCAALINIGLAMFGEDRFGTDPGGAQVLRVGGGA